MNVRNKIILYCLLGALFLSPFFIWDVHYFNALSLEMMHRITFLGIKIPFSKDIVIETQASSLFNVKAANVHTDTAFNTAWVAYSYRLSISRALGISSGGHGRAVRYLISRPAIYVEISQESDCMRTRLAEIVGQFIAERKDYSEAKYELEKRYHAALSQNLAETETAPEPGGDNKEEMSPPPLEVKNNGR